MKRAAERKRKDSKRKIQSIRTTMAKGLMNDNKKGDMANCDPKKSKEDMKTYCNENFSDDVDKVQECLATEFDFCFMCCENEFGRMYEDLREKCQTQCDKVGGKSGEGYWAWVPGSAKVDPADRPAKPAVKTL